MAAFILPITKALGAGMGIWSGAQSAHAAGAAANVRTGSYDDAIKTFREGMDTGNAYLQDARDKAIDWTSGAANYAGSTAVDQATRSAADVSGRADTANTYLDPYYQAGKTALGQISDAANKQFTFSQDDPSYQWRLQQGQQALDRGAAARGGSQGGGAAKALAQYGQNAASTEYQSAFNRFQDARKTQLQALGGLAQLGYGASGQQGANLIRAGEYGGNLMQQGTEYAGNAGMRAAEYGGNAAMNTGTQLASNERWGASNMAEMGLGRGDSIAAGILGQQAGKNQMWSAAGQGIMGVGQGIADYYNTRAQMPGAGGFSPSPAGTYAPISMDTFGGGSGGGFSPPTVNPYSGPTQYSGIPPINFGAG